MDPSDSSERRRSGEPIEEFLIFKIIRLLNFLGRSHDLSKTYNLSVKEWRIMLVIASHPEISAKEISFLSGYTEMAISRAINLLIKKKYVVRSMDGADRRRSMLRLSDKGGKR